MNDIGLTGKQLNERDGAFGALTTGQITAALIEAGVAKITVARHGNVYNQLRCGQIDAVVGTLKAGSSAGKHKDARKALRKALRSFVPYL